MDVENRKVLILPFHDGLHGEGTVGIGKADVSSFKGGARIQPASLLQRATPAAAFPLIATKNCSAGLWVTWSIGLWMMLVLKRQSLEPAVGLVVGGVYDFEAEAQEEAVEDGVADVPGLCGEYLR